MIDRILLFLIGVCIMLMSIVTLADADGYYMQSNGCWTWGFHRHQAGKVCF